MVNAHATALTTTPQHAGDFGSAGSLLVWTSAVQEYGSECDLVDSCFAVVHNLGSLATFWNIRCMTSNDNGSDGIKGINFVIDKVLPTLLGIILAPLVFSLVLDQFDVSVGYWLALSIIFGARFSLGAVLGVSAIRGVARPLFTKAKLDVSKPKVSRAVQAIGMYLGSSLIALVMLSVFGIETPVIAVFAAFAVLMLLGFLLEAPFRIIAKNRSSNN